MLKKQIFLAALAALTLLTSCEKVSPAGILMAGTAVEDRVKMSDVYYKEYLDDYDLRLTSDEYTFLVGSDSHLTTDPGRMDEMFAIGLEGEDLLYAHLGDIADTKVEYYVTLDSLIRKAKERYIDKYYVKNSRGFYYFRGDEEGAESADLIADDIDFPFFPVVGNHDITRNGWALWSNIFHSSFYEIPVIVIMDDGEIAIDRFIFLDTASGTLGKTQVDLIESGVLDGSEGYTYRHTFVFGHTNIFRPQFMEFASTFAREETFFLLNQFNKWNTNIVFCGHVHKWDERIYNNVVFLTLDSMSERNSPEPGDYLLRVHVKRDGTLWWEKVLMD